ncbi:MAG: hypothetical protein E6R04_00985 [Spirochaetes bacterium]|nr:MAG: hypothetical protein E6R04_00985 [Spirochaetota bacterium]
MKILLASEVILKGLDPTKPHKTLDSNGRLAMSSNKPVNSTVSSFLPSPVVVEQLVEQVQVPAPVENSTDVSEVLTSAPTLAPVEPVVSEPTSETTAEVTANIRVDESTLPELEKPATIPSPAKGKGKAVSKKAS